MPTVDKHREHSSVAARRRESVLSLTRERRVRSFGLLALGLPVGMLCACASGGGGASASAERGPFAATRTFTRYTYELQASSRWIDRGLPRLSPWGHSASEIRIDSLGIDDRSGRTRLVFGDSRSGVATDVPSGSGVDRAVVLIDRAGRLLTFDFTPRPIGRSSPLDPWEWFRVTKARATDEDEIAIPAVRLVELIPAVPDRLERGARWTTPIDLDGAQDGFSQSLSGRRTSVVVGDTIVDGHQLWIVRDSARVEYSERELDLERTLDALVTIERRGAGTLVGRSIYDPALRLFRTRTDTTLLTGEIVLSYPDGRRFRKPASYARERRLTLRDSTAQAVRLAELKAEQRRRPGGAVAVVTEDDEGILRGYPRSRDSLIAMVRTTDDLDRRRYAISLLESWNEGSSDGRVLAAQLAAEVGDTAWIVGKLTDRLSPHSGRLPADSLGLAIEYMADPGRVFALGLPIDEMYEATHDAIMRKPPLPLVDSREWFCARAVCDLLASQWTAAREPRLRDLGLLTLLMLDPARWADTVLARARETPTPLLRDAAIMISDTGTTGGRPAARVLLAPTATWQDWMHWVAGWDPRTPRRQLTDIGAGIPSAPHVLPLQIHAAGAGRDLRAELRAALATAQSDSARLAFGVALMRLHGDPPPPDTIARHLRAGSVALNSLARVALRSVFGMGVGPYSYGRRSAPAPDSATIATVIDQYLEGGMAWPSFRPPPGTPVAGGPGSGRPMRAFEPDEYFVAEGLPAAVRAKWSSRIPMITRADWNAQPTRKGGSLTLISVEAAIGPFVYVAVSHSGRLDRSPDQGPHHYASGEEFFLMNIDGRWVIIELISQWIT